MGSWLAEQGRIPDYLISSPAVRALETARLAAKAMRLPVQEIRQEKAVYEADLKRLLQILRAVPKSDRRVLLVGHNQGIEQLVQYLGAGKIQVPEDGKLMPTAALARFRVVRPWKELDTGVVEFLEIIRPRQLDREK